ncbi:hypothetical protein P7K49_037746 [Saguinus oedipus]|uniref:Uncharacterized protein n=1 Tax=Saguinus oedipus TaxID=9490 RepID=A0ABQ9TJU2_SAGOE|nr:hypothetical protein P7K49_037746 [Saguinus oedipus]
MALGGLTRRVRGRVGLTPFAATSGGGGGGGGGGAREGRRLGPDASPPPPRRIAARCPPGLEQQHHADLCLGCKPGRPLRAKEGSWLLWETQPHHRALSCSQASGGSLVPGSAQRRLREAEGARRGRGRGACVRGAARTMAGDSEQTLQNHQQPNGGEPFLIGRQGTAGPRATLPSQLRFPGGVCGGRRMWRAAVGRVSCCSHRVASAPPLPAALQRRVRPARPGDAAAGRANTQAIESQGWRASLAILPGRMLIVFQVQCWGEGFPQIPLEPLMDRPHPRSGTDVLAPRRSPRGREGEGGGNARGGVPGKGSPPLRCDYLFLPPLNSLQLHLEHGFLKGACELGAGLERQDDASPGWGDQSRKAGCRHEERATSAKSPDLVAGTVELLY